MLLTNSLACLQAWRVRFGLLGALICLLVACEKVESTDEKNPVPKDAVRLLFTYSSEKEDWIKDVTATFNRGRFKTKAGKPIYVDAIAEGSGECIDKIVNDSQKADLVSPASEVFVRLGNAEGRAKLVLLRNSRRGARRQNPGVRRGDAISVTNGLGESALKPGTHLAAKRRFNMA
jgi:hypothetical protein